MGSLSTDREGKCSACHDTGWVWKGPQDNPANRTACAQDGCPRAAHHAKFHELLQQLQRHKTSGRIPYIDEALNAIAGHVHAHPEVLSADTKLDEYVRSLDTQAAFIWGAPWLQPHSSSVN
jgi:hypothetical protein